MNIEDQTQAHLDCLQRLQDWLEDMRRDKYEHAQTLPTTEAFQSAYNLLIGVLTTTQQRVVIAQQRIVNIGDFKD